MNFILGDISATFGKSTIGQSLVIQADTFQTLKDSLSRAWQTKAVTFFLLEIY